MCRTTPDNTAEEMITMAGIRSVPVDTSRMTLIATGKASSAAGSFIDDGKGGSRYAADQQMYDNGVPVWRVEVLALPSNPEDARDGSTVMEVTITNAERPASPSFGEVVVFDNLMCQLPYYSKARSAMGEARFAATGIVSTVSPGRSNGNGKAHAEAAAS